jgi:hemerythrin-like domain-containing protein
MKRSEALKPLSHDHHVTLEAALRLRRATEHNVALAGARFAAFWHRAGERHFEIEEKLILPALEGRDPAWRDAVQRVQVDHADIRARVLALDGTDVDAAHILGERLHAHVRFEERVLFPLLERALDEAELAELGERVRAAER